MRRFLRPFRPVLDPVFECFSFFFTQKNSRFLSFFGKIPALFRNNPALFRQNPALFHQNPALIYSTFIAARLAGIPSSYPEGQLARGSPLQEIGGGNAKMLLELACEVLWIVESETFGSL